MLAHFLAAVSRALAFHIDGGSAPMKAVQENHELYVERDDEHRRYKESENENDEVQADRGRYGSVGPFDYAKLSRDVRPVKKRQRAP